MNELTIFPSDEQNEIINSLNSNDAVVVQAVAGSGKSTTTFLLAIKNPNKKILVITYNKELKNEMQNKAKKYNIKNISIYTFHGLATFLCNKSNKSWNNYIHNDALLSDWLNNDSIEQLVKKYLKFDILVADEFQDCNQIYWNFLKILLKSFSKTKFLVLGDFRQTIYEFKGSFDWWLNNLEKLLVNKKVAKLNLTTSYRISNNVANFLNNYCLRPGSTKINAINSNNIKTQYWHFENFFNPDKLMKIVNYIKDHQEYKPQDIFIICNSLNSGINSDTPVKILENLLVKNNIPVFYPDDDERSIKKNISKNKVIFCTPWTAKGRERKLVFYLSFGYTFDNKYDEQFSLDEINNPTYVGLTRALNELIIINANNSKLKKRTSFKFINYDKLLNDDEILIPEWSKNNLITNLNLEFKELNNSKIPKLNLNGSRLGKYLPTNLEIEINSLIEEISLNQNQKIELIQLPNSTKKENNLVQDVSVINSILFTSISCDKLKNNNIDTDVSNQTLNMTLNNLQCDEINYYINEDIDELINQNTNIKKIFNDNKNDIETNLLKSTIIYCLSNKLLNPIKQINNYSWLNEFKDWNFVKNRTIKTINNSLKFLKNNIDLNKFFLEIGIWISSELNDEISYYFKKWIDDQFDNKLELEKFDLVGKFDLVIQNLYFEFKFTNSLSIENKIQVVFYMFLLNIYKQYKESKNFKKTKNDFQIPEYYHLFNIRSNEWIVLKNDETIINKIIKLIIKNNISNKKNIPDDFIDINKIEY